MRLDVSDMSAFTMRIAKKKNGFPNFGYPSNLILIIIIFIVIEFSQKIIDTNFNNFCILYEMKALQGTTLNESTSSKK